MRGKVDGLIRQVTRISIGQVPPRDVISRNPRVHMDLDQVYGRARTFMIVI